MNNLNVDDLPNETIQRIFGYLNLESKLSAGLACRRWFSILKPVFVNLTEILLIFEDDYCRFSSVVRVLHQETTTNSSSKKNKNRRPFSIDEENGSSGSLTINLCACPQHLSGHRDSLSIILTSAGRFVKKLMVEDYLLQKGCFVEADLLINFVKRCSSLTAFELHNVDLSRVGEKDFLEIFRSTTNRYLTELFFDQCSWSSWTESSMNRVLKSILVRAINLREIHVTSCSLLNDQTLQLMAGMCRNLWYVDLSGCRSITAHGLVNFFHRINDRQSDLLYLKIHKTRIDGNELQYLLLRGGSSSTIHDDLQWAVCNFVMETGHRACSFQNRYVPGKSIVVFM